MDSEAKFLETIIEEEEEAFALTSARERYAKRHQKLQKKNKSNIEGFLGSGPRATAVLRGPVYYGLLFAWSVQKHLKEGKWAIISALGYRNPEPTYMPVDVDYEKKEDALLNGQVLVEKDDTKLVITIDILPGMNNHIQVDSHIDNDGKSKDFIKEIEKVADSYNFYRGKRVEFVSEGFRFLDVETRCWDTIVIDDGVREEILANTVGFLNNKDIWIRYKMPLKRGVMLVGEPGTGKTAVCKAVMAQAENMTCIITNSNYFDHPGYIDDLYEVAQDLSPTIVFLDDIDLIGQDRVEFGYSRGTTLLSLFAKLDGIEDNKEVVTIATTNCLDILDKALSNRPSRFDRIIHFLKPTYKQRKELVQILSKNIALTADTQNYIAEQSNCCTPAQLQEIIYGLVVESVYTGSKPENGIFDFNQKNIDSMILRFNTSIKQQIGFTVAETHTRESVNPLNNKAQ
jgi:cell division protease FtsH